MTFRIEEAGVHAGVNTFVGTGNPILGASCVSNTNVKADAGIVATKLEHQYALHYWLPDGADIASAVIPIHTVRGLTGDIVGVQAVCFDAPSGGDKKFTVDLRVCKAADPDGSEQDVLTAAIDYANATADLTVKPGTLGTGTLVVGDTIVVDIVASGSTGSQGQGLVVTVTIREDAE